MSPEVPDVGEGGDILARLRENLLLEQISITLPTGKVGRFLWRNLRPDVLQKPQGQTRGNSVHVKSLFGLPL
eukprot:6930350-Alexandrium_andersonii.AAC.1